MMKQPSSVVELLVHLVSFDTVNEVTSKVPFPERKMLESIEDLAQAWGFITTHLPIASNPEDASYNLLITYEPSADAPWLAFESHADTVTVEGMTEAPFLAAIKDGRVYGRGVCDTKGSGAAMLWALREYAALPKHTNNIAILFVTDEEEQKTGATAFVQKQLSKIDWTPVGIVVGEPTKCTVIVAHNGVYRTRIRTRGVAAHSSNPANGKSAISAMAKLILQFEKEYCSKIDFTHPLTGSAACSVNTISGGSAVNIIPEYCEVKIDRRILPGEDGNKIHDQIGKVLNSIMEKDPSIEIETFVPFIDFPLDPAVGTAFGEKISEILVGLGLTGERFGAPYGTDASTYSVAGIPAVVLGPGSVDQAHTKDEWIEVDQLEKAISVYVEIMKSTF